MEKVRGIGGGLSPVQPATENIQKMADGVKNEAEKWINMVFDFFKVISYRMQITVFGKNYIVTAQVSFESFVVLEILVSPDGNVILAEAEELLPETPIPKLSKPVSPPLLATPWVQSMVDDVKKEVETQTGQTYGMFKALSFRSECTKGINYLILVQVSKHRVVQLAMFEDPSGTAKLTGIKFGVPPCLPALFGPVPQLSYYLQNPISLPKIVDPFIRQAEHQLHINFIKLNVLYYSLEIDDGFITYEIAGWPGVDGKSLFVIKLFQTLGGQVQLTLADLIPVEPFSIPSKYCQSKILPVWLCWPYSCPYEPTPRIQKMVDEVKHEVEVQEQKKGTLKAISFRSRSIDGINFLIGVQLTTAKEEIFWLGLGIYESLDGKIALTGIKNNISWCILPPFYPIPESMYEPATERTQKIANDVKEEAAGKVNLFFKKYEAICYSSKVNGGVGVDYHVIVWISDVDYDFLNLEILVSLEGKVQFVDATVGVGQYLADVYQGQS